MRAHIVIALIFGFVLGLLLGRASLASENRHLDDLDSFNQLLPKRVGTPQHVTIAQEIAVAPIAEGDRVEKRTRRCLDVSHSRGLEELAQNASLKTRQSDSEHCADRPRLPQAPV